MNSKIISYLDCLLIAAEIYMTVLLKARFWFFLSFFPWSIQIQTITVFKACMCPLLQHTFVLHTYGRTCACLFAHTKHTDPLTMGLRQVLFCCLKKQFSSQNTSTYFHAAVPDYQKFSFKKSESCLRERRERCIKFKYMNFKISTQQ